MAEDMLNVIAFNYRFQHAGPSEVEETEGVYRKYLENVREIDSQIQSFRLTITLECGTLQFLEKLWSDYLKGHLNEMVRTLLVTEGIAKDFGLVTVKLNTTIMDEEYWACREYFLNRTGMFLTTSDHYMACSNTAKFHSFGIGSVRELGSLYYDENKACPSANDS